MNENSFLATNTAKNRNGVPSCTRHYCAADKLLAHKEIVFMGQEPGDLISENSSLTEYPCTHVRQTDLALQLLLDAQAIPWQQADPSLDLPAKSQ